MGLTRLKIGKQQNCDNIRSMTISGVTVTKVDFIMLSYTKDFSSLHHTKGELVTK